MPTAKPSALKLVFTSLYILIYPAILLFLSGDWLWPEGWIFSAWFIALCASTIAYLYMNDPALLAERYKQPGQGNQKGWDKYVVYGLSLGFFAWIAIIPLDAKRYGWTASFPPALKILGGIALLASSFLFFRAFSDNTFLSALVRIQKDRKQHVVTTGVYGFVRHPMYLGGTLLFFGAPLLMGSLYGIGVGAALTLLIAGRIIGEERALVGELEGYDDYRKKVRFRLVPFIW